jgi:hypothetical protein
MHNLINFGFAVSPSSSRGGFISPIVLRAKGYDALPADR